MFPLCEQLDFSISNVGEGKRLRFTIRSDTIESSPRLCYGNVFDPRKQLKPFVVPSAPELAAWLREKEDEWCYEWKISC